MAVLIRPPRGAIRPVLAAVVVWLLGLSAGADAQNLTLSIDKGLVTIDAENVTVDEVLARWSRITGLNVISKTGTGSDIPLSLHLSRVPEREAMALLLKSLSGYIMGERHDPDTGVITIDRLLILTQSAAQAPAVGAMVPAAEPDSPVSDVDP